MRLLDSLECGHFGERLAQLLQLFRGDHLALPATAAGADVADDADIAADGIAVDGVVDGAVANAMVMHAADNGLECFDVPGGVAVQFDVADVACVAQGVVPLS